MLSLQSSRHATLKSALIIIPIASVFMAMIFQLDLFSIFKASLIVMIALVIILRRNYRKSNFHCDPSSY